MVNAMAGQTINIFEAEFNVCVNSLTFRQLYFDWKFKKLFVNSLQTERKFIFELS